MGPVRLRWVGAALVSAAVAAPAVAAAAATPALVVGESCTSGDDASGIEAAVTGLADGTKITFTVRGGDQVVGPATFQSFEGRAGIGVGFGRRVETASVEAIVRSDGDGSVEPGEQLLTGSVSRPCWSSAK